jgi:hypothetical protein|nr:MAG TPA: helix-turn-helix domain protein [Caudoviricetes sp.]
MMRNEKVPAGAATPCAGTQLKNHEHYTALLGKCQKGTQEYIVLQHIIKCGGITALEASDEYDITRLSARIYDLRKLGIPIENTRQKSKNGKRFVRYILGD